MPMLANASSSTLQIFDVSNPASPVSAGSVTTQAHRQLVDYKAAIPVPSLNLSNTLQIFDVSNPASPACSGIGSKPCHP